jgi:soluble lytic murein transglycosylase-like protein
MQVDARNRLEMGVGNSFDPQQNIEAGVRYLKYLQTCTKMTAWLWRPTTRDPPPC